MQDFQNSLVIRLNLRLTVINLRHTVGQKTFVSHFSLQRAHMHASVLKSVFFNRYISFFSDLQNKRVKKQLQSFIEFCAKQKRGHTTWP